VVFLTPSAQLVSAALRTFAGVDSWLVSDVPSAAYDQVCTTSCVLSAEYCQLRTASFEPAIACDQLRTVSCVLPAAYCQLRTARLRTASCVLSAVRCQLRIPSCVRPAAYCQLRKRQGHVGETSVYWAPLVVLLTPSAQLVSAAIQTFAGVDSWLVSGVPSAAYDQVCTASCVLPAEYCQLRTASFEPAIACDQLRTVSCVLPVAYRQASHCQLRTVSCAMPAAYSQLRIASCVLPVA
jgi:hypothetical protein